MLVAIAGLALGSCICLVTAHWSHSSVSELPLIGHQNLVQTTWAGMVQTSGCDDRYNLARAWVHELVVYQELSIKLQKAVISLAPSQYLLLQS